MDRRAGVWRTGMKWVIVAGNAPYPYKAGGVLAKGMLAYWDKELVEANAFAGMHQSAVLLATRSGNWVADKKAA